MQFLLLIFFLIKFFCTLPGKCLLTRLQWFGCLDRGRTPLKLRWHRRLWRGGSGGQRLSHGGTRVEGEG